MLLESDIVELKREITEDLKKEVIAFANASGGVIYIGVDNDGAIIGVQALDDSINRITNMIRDTIKPDVTMFVEVFGETHDNIDIIKIIVHEASRKPYYLAAKGMKSSGVYIRQGNSSVPVLDEQIRHMIKLSDGSSYEEMRSKIQNLTFDECKNFFRSRELSLEESHYRTLGFKNIKEDLFTNAGLLFSDQSNQSIKIAVFQGLSKSIFIDRKEFTGSLLRQLEECYEYISLYNKVYAKIEGLYREDKKDYPEIAIREALLNAIIHRDYAIGGSTLISIFDNRIEFVNLGGLVDGITLDDVTYGISVSRNKVIASLFYRLKYVEAYGTGISKIFESYHDFSLKPAIEISDNVFKLTLFNRNAYIQDDKSLHQVKILDEIKRKGSISRKQVEDLLNVSQTMSGRILKNMVDENMINKTGKGPKTKYIIK